MVYFPFEFIIISSEAQRSLWKSPFGWLLQRFLNTLKQVLHALGIVFCSYILLEMNSAFSKLPSRMTKRSSAEMYFPHSLDLLSDLLSRKMELEQLSDDSEFKIPLDKPGATLICGSCEEDARAFSRCKDCDELLCENCKKAHARVKLTKDHSIISVIDDCYIDTPSTSCSSPDFSYTGNSLTNSGEICDFHHDEPLQSYCNNCNVIFCTECNTSEHKNHSCKQAREAFDKAEILSMKILNEAKINILAIKECLNMSDKMKDSVNSRSLTVSREIKNMMQRFHTAIDERESDLLEKLKQILFAKNKAIDNQIESFKTLFNSFSDAARELTDILESGAPIDIIRVRDKVSCKLQKLRTIRHNMIQVDDTVQILPPDWSILLAISSMGDVLGYNKIILNNKFNDLLRPKPFEPLNLEDLKRTVSFFQKQDHSLFQSSQESSMKFLRSPTKKKKQRNIHVDYSNIGTSVLIIGGEGDGDGQLCRPWGVCCSSDGNIIVADRSNNRIQVFSSSGKFLFKFGTLGSAQGCFDRPAGITTDFRDRIIVADKDNHRIQVFTNKGIFLLSFGEKGSKIGQFNYPWDVATDSQGRIAVSDSRNHRVQLFDSEGTYIAKYGFDVTPASIKQFDSPRGLCFTSNGSIIVTDFNNHRLVVIEPNLQSGRFVGTEGSGEKQFLRPQGIAIDANGNIVVADARNHRIQIFRLKGNYIRQFGTMGKEPGQMDRPSGLCISPTGKIIVVDFGNNRVQVF